MSLAGMSVSQLQKELNKRQRKLPKLNRKRAGLMRQMTTLGRKLAKVDAAITALGGGGGGGRRGGGAGTRARNEVSLVEALHGVLKGKTLGVQEASDAVKASGYKTNSPNFRVMVNQALVSTKNKKLFKRVERGRYTQA